jgi:hypothetical protein
VADILPKGTIHRQCLSGATPCRGPEPSEGKTSGTLTLSLSRERSLSHTHTIFVREKSWSDHLRSVDDLPPERQCRHPLRSQMHAHEAPAHKVSAYKVSAHEVHVHKVLAHEVRAHKVHAHKVSAHEVHTYKVSAYEVPGP